MNVRPGSAVLPRRSRTWVIVVCVALVVGVAGPAGAAPGDALWVSRYNGGIGFQDTANAMAVSPDGTRVFVTGTSGPSTGVKSWATVAYNTATGAAVWTRRLAGGSARAIVVSHSGARVYVTGTAGAGYGDYSTSAYNATTGAVIWTKTYNGPGMRQDTTRAVALSPDDSKVFVTGWSIGSGGGADYATIAYNAATGAALWTRRYTGPGNRDDIADALAVSPNGSKVYVTGSSTAANNFVHATTSAYSASTGAVLWTRTVVADSAAAAVVVSPDGSRIIITGQETGPGQDGMDFMTLAYNASTGALVWGRAYNGNVTPSADSATALATSPDGSRIYVTGWSETSFGTAYATIAYNAATGASVWSKSYSLNTSSTEHPTAVAASPDGSAVYVTGAASAANGEAQTIAYDAATGADSWAESLTASGKLNAVAVSPDSSRIFVTGWQDYGDGMHSNEDYTTIAYSAT